MNILYCIIHTEKQHTRASNIVSTWGENQNLLFYSDHEDPKINCHKVTDRSDYASGQVKQINVFPLILNKFNHYDWYFFCDNDTFVNTSKLNNFALTADIKYIHGDIINSWQQDKSLYYPSGGAGYLVSNYLLQKFVNLSYNDIPFGDVSIGINIRKIGISLMHSNLFKGHTPEHFNIKDKNVQEYVTFHYITESQLMLKLYNLVNQNEHR